MDDETKAHQIVSLILEKTEGERQKLEKENIRLQKHIESLKAILDIEGIDLRLCTICDKWCDLNFAIYCDRGHELRNCVCWDCQNEHNLLCKGEEGICDQCTIHDSYHCERNSQIPPHVVFFFDKLDLIVTSYFHGSPEVICKQCHNEKS